MTTRAEALATLTAPGQPFELTTAEGPRGSIRVFKNAPPTLLDLYAAARSDLDFLVYEGERLTFNAVWDAACALAQALRDDHGVTVGQTVAISARNYPEWMIAFNAVTAIGAVAVALNAMWRPHEFEYGLADCGARVLICDGERAAQLAEFSTKDATRGAPAGVAVIGMRLGDGAAPAGVARWEEVLAGAPGARGTMPAPSRPFGPDDDAVMLYTSGSSGAPKGVVSSHRAVLSALLSWELDAAAAVLTGLLPAPVEGGPQPGAVLGIPLFHVTGLHTIYLSSFRAQRRVISMYKWDAERAAALIEAERATSFVGPPAVTGDLIVAARAAGRDLSSLVQVGGGGASRAPEQVRAIAATFANARPGTGWGMTETNAIGVGIAAADYLERPESSGRVSAVLDIMLGEGGELLVRGASMFRCYWGRPEATAEAHLPGGWFRTGDVARIDADGFVYIIDRIKDLVIRGGENVGCGAVEAALLEHPAVVEACVYGVPDARLGEEVGASVYALGVTEAELQDFVRDKLARFEVPRYIRVVAAPLPRIATGKILRRQLRAEHAAQLNP